MWSHRDINDQYSAHISASASDPVLSWIAVMPDADAAVIDGKTFYLHKHPVYRNVYIRHCSGDFHM